MSTEFDEAVPGNEDVEADLDGEDELADTVALPESEAVVGPTDNVGDVSVEINVEQLIADIEAEDNDDSTKKKEVRRKLEELAEDKSFEDTYAVEFDKD